jgi:N,N'-diacetyllegionaminate synthase
METYIIAEAGVNHNGDFATACRLVDAAKAAGANCVKFQTFRAEELVSVHAEQAAYQRASMTGTSTQLEILKSLELTESDFKNLQAYCAKIGINFLSTPFDLESIAFLDTLGVPFWKIPSGEVTNLPYLLAIAKTKKPVVMSTGMCGLDEIRTTVKILTDNGTPDIILLQCNTEYPTPYEDVNLRAIQTLQKEFGLKVGYSDHTPGIEIPIAAAAMGAVIIEKHFTLDRTKKGPDHKASIEPEELMAMVRGIRNVERALGDGVKSVRASERKNLDVARKSIVARCAISRGEPLTEKNITTKRPGNGVSPMRWFEALGRPASRDYEKDELIEF